MHGRVQDGVGTALSSTENRGAIMDERRLKKLEHLIRNEVEEIIRRDVSDPRIGLFSITDVKVSPDMKNARVSISFMGSPEEQGKALEGIKSARGFIRHKLSGRMAMRFVPELTFAHDERPELRIESLLAELRKERDEREQGTGS